MGTKGKKPPATSAKGGETAPAETAPAEMTEAAETAAKVRGYGEGGVSAVLSAAEVTDEALTLAAEEAPSLETLSNLAAPQDTAVAIDGLQAGYGHLQILFDFCLRLGAGQSLCLIGPNGAGKSTVLHSLFGFTDIFAGHARVFGHDISRAKSHERLQQHGLAYIMQASSIFPDMTVEENLWLGGFLLSRPADARERTEKVLAQYPQLERRRGQKAKVLSGGERRLLEISRALIMDPSVLLVDEPSIGLEPKYIDMVFEILLDLQKNSGKTLLMVEQNARKGLSVADIGYVLVAGRLVRAGAGRELLEDPRVGRLFLGG